MDERGPEEGGLGRDIAPDEDVGSRLDGVAGVVGFGYGRDGGRLYGPRPVQGSTTPVQLSGDPKRTTEVSPSDRTTRSVPNWTFCRVGDQRRGKEGQCWGTEEGRSLPTQWG